MLKAANLTVGQKNKIAEFEKGVSCRVERGCPPKAYVKVFRAEREFERGEKFKDLPDQCPSLHTRKKSA